MTCWARLGTERYQPSMFDYHSAPRFEPDQGKCSGAGDENRTRMTSLEGIRAPTRADSDAPAGLTWLHREAPSLALA
jgi:hypothetical protein